MPGDSDQDLLLPTDMAEETEMSVFGMRSLWNRMGKHKIKKTTSSSNHLGHALQGALGSVMSLPGL